MHAVADVNVDGLSELLVGKLRQNGILKTHTGIAEKGRKISKLRTAEIEKN